MTEYERKTEQIKMFGQYVDYVKEIYNYNKANQIPINISLLAKSLEKAKQQVSPVIKKLETVGLIIVTEIPEYQKRGGRSKFIILSEDGFHHYQEYYSEKGLGHVTPITSPITERERTDLKRAITEFTYAQVDNVRYLAINQIYNILIQIAGKNPHTDWNNEDYLIEWVRRFLDNPDRYSGTDQDFRIKRRFYNTLEWLYDHDYFDHQNITQLFNYYKDMELDESNPEHNLVNIVLDMVLTSMRKRPQDIDKGSYELFVLLIKKVRRIKQGNIYFLGNKRDEVKRLDNNIKDRLKTDLFKMASVDPPTPPERDEIIDELLGILHRG